MKSSLILVGLVILFTGSRLRAEISIGGDVVPYDPATWTLGTPTCVGNNANGTLTVNGGNAIDSYNSVMGYTANSTGDATIDGNGSSWTIVSSLSV